MPFSDVLRRTLKDPRAGAAVLALVARAAASAQAYADNPVVHRPQLDGMYYLQWAQEIAAGDLMGSAGLVGGAPLFLNPLYAYVIAPLAAVLGADVIAGVLVLQALLGAATAALVAACAERLFGRLAGWVAGVGVALSAALVHLDGHLSVSGLGAFLVAGAVWSAAPPRAQHGCAPRRRLAWHGPVASGLWLGLGALARPIAPLAVPFFAYIHWRRAPAGRRARAALLVIGVFLAPAALSLARNATLGGEAVVYTAASGANVYLGNNPAARRYRTMTAGPRFRFTPFEMHGDARRFMAPRLGIDATWSAISAEFTKDAIADATEHPGAALGFVIQKARWFATPMEVPSSACYDVDVELVPCLRFACVPSWLLVSLGLLGLIVQGRRREVICGPGSLVLAHLAVLTLVFPLSHYRSPAIPALAVLAGGAVAWGVAAWRGRHLTTVATGVVALLGIAGLGALAPQPARQVHTGMFTLAQCQRDAGRLDDAERWVRRGLEEFRAAWPQEPVPIVYWSVLGDVAFSRDGRFDVALEHYREVLALEPYDTGIRLNAVVCLMALERWEDSFAELEEIVRRDPTQTDNPVVLARFADALTRLGRLVEARRYVIEALRRAGPDPRERPRDWAIPPDLR